VAACRTVLPGGGAILWTVIASIRITKITCFIDREYSYAPCRWQKNEKYLIFGKVFADKPRARLLVSF
jgi:hypothetical protein